MSDMSWHGLVTNASPFAVPVGAAIEQVNLCSDIPGQIHSRGGMAPVSYVGESEEIRDVHAFESGDDVLLISITPRGLVVSTSPSRQERLEGAIDPLLASANGGVQTNYIHRYRNIGSDQEPGPPPPDGGGTDGPAPGSTTNIILGGSSSTPYDAFPFYVDANIQCDQENPIDEFFGGLSDTNFASSALLESRLCRNPFYTATATGEFNLTAESGDNLTDASGRLLSVYGTVFLRTEA